jgi:Cof subfamily protein (haloacid dehalogenase superfamily)
MDGTLLNDEHEVSDRFFKQYNILKAKGIHFTAASGRQLQSIRHALEPIKDEINIIGENGGILQHNNEVLTLLKLEQDQLTQCVDRLRKVENCYIILCGKNAAYFEQTDPEFIRLFRNYYHEAQHVEDLRAIIDDDFLKIAVFHFDSSEKYILPYVEDLKDDLKVIVSAKNWLDISHLESNKGYALHKLQQKLGITPEETLVFGDYNNDLEMIQLGKYSFAMENAHPKVKEAANFMTKSNNEQGVEHVLDMLIDSLN